MEQLLIGDATLYHGDAYKLLPHIGAVDCMCVDPEYLMKTSGGGRFRKQRKSMDAIQDAGMTGGFDCSIFKPELYNSIVTFCHNDQVSELTTHFKEYYDRHAVCFWEKTNPSPLANKNYQSGIEIYIHAWNMGHYPLGIIKGDVNDMKKTVRGAVVKSEYDHPTVKPDYVMDKIMKNINGKTVIDCFAGTGSTGVAALKAGKKFIGIEKELKYFHIMVERLFEFYAEKEKQA